MAQTCRLTHRYGIFRVCAIWVGQATGSSHTGCRPYGRHHSFRSGFTVRSGFGTISGPKSKPDRQNRSGPHSLPPDANIAKFRAEAEPKTGPEASPRDREDDKPLCRTILWYAILLPGRKSAFRAGFWPDCFREGTEIGPPAGLRPAGGPISVISRWQSCQNLARESDFRLGTTIA
jgi:hypothetical protein